MKSVNLHQVLLASSINTNSKITFIRSITDAVLSGYLFFDELALLSDEEAFKKLTNVHGIETGQQKCILYSL